MDFIEDKFKFNSIYRAEVVDNDDPERLGRVRLLVFDFMSGISKSDYSKLPWAVPAFSLLSGGSGDGVGCFSVPNVGSNVFCFFEGGDIHQPVYFAEASDGKRGVLSESKEDYPSSRVVKFKDGVYLKLNEKKDEISVIHPKYSLIIDKDGNVRVEANDVNVSVNNYDLSAKGDVSVKNLVSSLSMSSSGVVLSTSGGLTVSVEGGVVISSPNGTLSILPGGVSIQSLGAFSVLSAGPITLNAPVVYLP